MVFSINGILFTGDATAATLRAFGCFEKTNGLGEINDFEFYGDHDFVIKNRKLLENVRVLIAPHHGSDSHGSHYWTIATMFFARSNFNCAIFPADPMHTKFNHPRANASRRLLGLFPGSAILPTSHDVIYHSQLHEDDDEYEKKNRKTHKALFDVYRSIWLSLKFNLLKMFSHDRSIETNTLSFNNLPSSTEEIRGYLVKKANAYLNRSEALEKIRATFFNAVRMLSTYDKESVEILDCFLKKLNGLQQITSNILIAAMEWDSFDEITVLILQSIGGQSLEESSRDILMAAMRWSAFDEITVSILRGIAGQLLEEPNRDILIAAMRWSVFDEVTMPILRSIAKQLLEEPNRDILIAAMRWSAFDEITVPVLRSIAGQLLEGPNRDIFIVAMRWPTFDEITLPVLRSIAGQLLEEQNIGVLVAAMRWSRFNDITLSVSQNSDDQE